MILEYFKVNKSAINATKKHLWQWSQKKKQETRKKINSSWYSCYLLSQIIQMFVCILDNRLNNVAHTDHFLTKCGNNIEVPKSWSNKLSKEALISIIKASKIEKIIYTCIIYLHDP